MSKTLEKLLKGLNLDDKKINEVKNKPQIEQNIKEIGDACDEFTKMQYSLACTAPKNVNILRVSKMIDQGLIKHDNMLRGVYKKLEKDISDEDLVDFIKTNDFAESEIKEKIEKMKNISKRDILREVKNEMPYADFKIVMSIVNELEEPTVAETALPEEKKDWLEEGEISRIHTPQTNYQLTDEILQAHLKRTGGKVVTRFPPEPNGNLHIGHAKALNLNFEYAKKFGGYTYLRYDDTNPKNESEEHFHSILEDVRWLGFEPYEITASSDYFDKMIQFSFDLIKKGKGYVCFCSLDDMRNRRKQFQAERDGGNFDPTILSPYRNTSIEDNLVEFQKMIDGGYAEGEATFRFKMDLESKNPLMLDLVGCRILNTIHPRKNKNFLVYPSYEFALCVSDSLEDVTHSFCSREFYTRQESYHWLLQNLNLYEPVQWEFSRLNLSNTILSKRKLQELVRRGINWDDPRFYTIKGMRRRGFTAIGINNFIKSVGITFTESIVDVKILENFVREDLNKIAKRVFCIRHPLKLIISNFQKKTVELPVVFGSEEKAMYPVEVNKCVYIDSSDFSENGSSDFFRLTKNQPVGLINFGVVKFVEKTAEGIVVQMVDEKPLKYVQWISNLNNKVELRLYKPLFFSFDPETVGYLNDINFESLEIVEGYCDGRVIGSKNLDKFQFMRVGYFVCDKDSKDDCLVFNLTLPLKNIAETQ
jgi:glutaminyl-tRNA synthetase